MSKKILLSLSLILMTLPPDAFLSAASASIEAYEEKRIANIEVTIENPPPNFSFDPKIVLSKLKTKVGDPFSQLTFDSDLKALSDDYDRVEPNVEVQNGEVYITLKVWPRPTIRTIHWHGNEYMKTKTLQKELGIKPNSTFNRQAFNKGFNKVKEYYIKKGYFESQLQYTLMNDPKTNQVDIDIEVKEGRSGCIDDIEFKGFTKDEESEILSMIHTKKYNLFVSWLTGWGTYNEEAVDQDRLTIINLLQNRGYADARVDLRIVEAKSKGKIIIEIEADRGVIYHFGEVTFNGNTLFTDKEIEGVFIARPEGAYSPEKLRQTAQAIKDMYGRKGHIEANVQYEAQLVEDQPIYNVHFEIEEGQEYKIGLIRIIGNVQTQSHVILRESLLVPGETFDSAKLKATQHRLENIGYFKNVNVYAVRTQDDISLGENYRDVYIEVQETTTGNISLFMGFSSADNIFGGLDLSENNFNYKGLPKIFKEGLSAVRGGGEYLHGRASFGARQSSYSLSWLDPYFRDTLWRLGFELNATYSSLPSKNYDIDTYGLTVYASYPIATYWSFGTKYRIRNAQIDIDLKNKKEEHKQDHNSGFISSIGASVSYDSTDHAIKPHNGFRSMFETEFAGLGGDFSFIRISYLNSLYTQLWKRGVMKYKFDFRFIDPLWKSPTFEKIPISERFFLGGEGSVRGYKPFSLGSQYEHNDPKGGISSSVLSIEYLQEVFSFCDGFLFIDAGAVSEQRFDVATYRASYGFGVRLELINRIPLVFGLGYPVNPEHKGQVRRFFFSMGGQF